MSASLPGSTLPPRKGTPVRLCRRLGEPPCWSGHRGWRKKSFGSAGGWPLYKPLTLITDIYVANCWLQSEYEWCLLFRKLIERPLCLIAISRLVIWKTLATGANQEAGSNKQVRKPYYSPRYRDWAINNFIMHNNQISLSHDLMMFGEMRVEVGKEEA
jgi:hypothetical protein